MTRGRMTDRDRKGRYRSYTGHITLTEQDETGQHRGGSRKSGESQRGRVRKQSRACFSGDDCMGVGVFRFFSHLIFGRFVQGFSIQVSNCGGCVTNLHFALTRPVWCACILCRWCVLTSRATMALCSAGLSSSDDTFKEKRALCSCRGQQFSPALWGHVLHVMSAPNGCS